MSRVPIRRCGIDGGPSIVGLFTTVTLKGNGSWQKRNEPKHWRSVTETAVSRLSRSDFPTNS